MTNEEKLWCQKKIWSGGYSRSRCSRRATVDGKWCKQHSPEAQTARDAESRARAHAKSKERADRQAREVFDARCGHIAREFGIEDPEALRAALAHVLPHPTND